MCPTRALVFTATYNERGNIQRFVEQVLHILPNCDLLVVDDHSPDGTGEVLDELAAREPRLKVIHRPAKLGLGTAHKLGMLYATRNGYDVLLTLDADFSHDPADLPRLLAALEDADYVTGSRFVRGGKCDYGGYRLAVSRLANWGVHRLLGTRLHEATTSLRGYRTSLLKQLPFHRICSDGYSFFVETTYWITAAGHRCLEIPIHFHNRAAGASKIPKLQILFGFLLLLRLFFFRLVGKRPTGTGPYSSEQKCYFCKSTHMLQKFRARGERKREFTTVCCTSMEHHNKPPIVQCLCCGLCYVPRSYYADKPVVQLYTGTEDLTYLEHQGGRHKTFNWVFKKLQPYLPATGKMLELGSYCGLFLEVAKRKGWHATGLEPSQWAARYARDVLHLDVRTGTLSDQRDCLGRDYDAVVAWDVLEHLEDPMGELAKIHEVLGDKGLLCFSTLDIENWYPRLMGRRWPWVMEMHLFYFSRTGLTEMLRAAGFEVVAVFPYCHFISLSYLLLKVQALFFKNAPKMGFLSRLLPRSLYVPFRFGDIKLFVCRKAATGPSARVELAKTAA
jgi:dolichol-phosphate mannosyltransferase